MGTVHKIDDGSAVRCTSCRESVRREAATCPHCGADFGVRTTTTDILKAVAGITLFIVGAIGAVFGPLTLVTAPLAVFSVGVAAAAENFLTGLVGTAMMVGGFGGFLRLDLEPVRVEEV